MTLIALTGATGFVGGHLLRHATAAGLRVRALARRSQPPMPGVEWLTGALDQPERLRALADGADAVLHVAGVINARDRAGFIAGNVTGTAAMAEAAEQAGVRRFVHVSSLAARESHLSDYGASKAESEAVIRASALDWSIVRPPAVYGPGDRETLELFRMATRGLVLLPPRGRLSVIHVDDLCRLLLGLALGTEPMAMVLEPDDGREEGWSHHDFALALGRAVGRRVRPLPLPGWLIHAGAAADTLRAWLSRGSPRLSFDRARYMVHPDWAVTATARPAATLWRPLVDTPTGLADTARWYRQEGWLR